MSFRVGCLTAILGLILAHPIVFGVAFLWGAVFGASEIMASGPGHSANGLEGGMKAMAVVAFVYLISFGLVPVGVSIGGAILAAGVVFVVSLMLRSKDATPSDVPAPTEPAEG